MKIDKPHIRTSPYFSSRIMGRCSNTWLIDCVNISCFLTIELSIFLFLFMQQIYRTRTLSTQPTVIPFQNGVEIVDHEENVDV